MTQATSPPGTYEALYAEVAWAATLVLLELWQCFLLRRAFNLGGEVHRWVHASCLCAVSSIMLGGILMCTSSFNDPQWTAGKRIWSLSNYSGGLAITAYVWLMLKAKYEGVKMQAEPQSLRYGLGLLWGMSIVTMIFAQVLTAAYKDERFLVLQTAYFTFFALASAILLFYHARVLILGLHVVLGNEQQPTAKNRWSKGLVLFKRRVVVIGFIYIALLGLSTNNSIGYYKQGKKPRAQEPPKPTDLAALFLLSLVIWSFWLNRTAGSTRAAARSRGVSLSPPRPTVGKKDTPSRGGPVSSGSTTAENNSPSVTAEDARKDVGSKDGDMLELVIDDPAAALASAKPDHKSDHEFQQLETMDRIEVELSE